MKKKTLASQAERHKLTDSLRDAFVEIKRRRERSQNKWLMPN